jgi:hypothetical protein
MMKQRDEQDAIVTSYLYTSKGCSPSPSVKRNDGDWYKHACDSPAQINVNYALSFYPGFEQEKWRSYGKLLVTAALVALSS